MTQKHSSAWAAKITCFLVWWMLTGLLPLHAMAAIQIRVSTPSAGTLRLDVESSDSIEALRQKIQDRIGIAPHQQTLSFDSTTLQDGRTLADYNVQHDSLLVLTLPVGREDLSSNVPIQQQLSAQAFATDLFITGQRNNIFNHLNHARSSQYNANQLRLAIDAPPQRHAKNWLKINIAISLFCWIRPILPRSIPLMKI
jgi:hypothetical protein